MFFVFETKIKLADSFPTGFSVVFSLHTINETATRNANSLHILLGYAEWRKNSFQQSTLQWSDGWISIAHHHRLQSIQNSFPEPNIIGSRIMIELKDENIHMHLDTIPVHHFCKVQLFEWHQVTMISFYCIVCCFNTVYLHIGFCTLN